MNKNIFLEFDEEKGVGDLLFVNMNQPTQYRFYRRRKNWDECYMVEFCSNSEDYHLFWGHNEQERSNGNRYRAFIFLKDMERWACRCELFTTLFKDTNNYNGHFTNDFYDLSLLYDVYKAWHFWGALLDNLKEQVPRIMLKYPNYSKEKVLIEGELAHNAFFENIRGIVENDE